MAIYLSLLEKHLKKGTLTLSLPGGDTHTFGTGKPEAHWVVKDEKALLRIARDWEFELGETYMQELWSVQDCSLADLIAVLRLNFSEPEPKPWTKPFIRLLAHWNKVSRSYKNVAHHYDLDEAFFRRFLDREMVYSCAYYADDDYDIHTAQQAKCEHIAKKLLIKPGMHVLDIGCGWGSLAFYLAERHGARVTGITLSKEQLKVALRRAEERGLQNRVHFELCDYREHHQVYDRIVSVGMFEHVGAPFYGIYFKRISDMLKKDGVALMHTVGRSTPPGLTNPWILKYIFPGGCIPALSETALAVEKSGMMISDTEVWRIHYANTLRDWNARFQRHRDDIRDEKGERFCRMWEFYLVTCEAAFRYSDLVVFQVQMAKQHGVVPITRDYLHPNPLLERMPRSDRQIAEPQPRRNNETVAS